MTLCGHTIEHCPHWMHRSASQIGTCSAMLRFSYCVVPVGYVPSIGSALTGSASPRPSSITAVTLRTKAGRRAGTVCARRRAAGGGARHLDLVQVGERIVDRREVLLHDLRALARVGPFGLLLDRRDRLVARQHARQREEAGLQDRVDARAEAEAEGDLRGVDDVELELPVDDLLLDLARQLVPDGVRRRTDC